MNTITIHGNVVRAAIKSAESGKSYLVATVASDRSKHEDLSTDFFRVVQFENIGDIELAKGDFVKVTGTVCLGSYEGKPTIEVLARKIERPVRREKAA